MEQEPISIQTATAQPFQEDAVQVPEGLEWVNETPRMAAALQFKIIANAGAVDPPPASNPTPTSLPAQLRTNLENLSGLPMNDVQVHYNSSRPAQYNARAYAYGTSIHLAPGQEQHLPHEAWHVVQQKQGRVPATGSMPDNMPANNDSALELEADRMGAQAAQPSADQNPVEPQETATTTPAIQRLIYLREHDHVRMPLRPTVAGALEDLGMDATRAHYVARMELLADFLTDTTHRVITATQLRAWIRESAPAGPAGAGVPGPPFEATDPEEFPPGVEGYVRNIAGYMMVPNGTIEVEPGVQMQEGWLPLALRQKNVSRSDHRYSSETERTNRISAGVTILYRDAEGATQHWQGLINGQWHSGDYAAPWTPPASKRKAAAAVKVPAFGSSSSSGDAASASPKVVPVKVATTASKVSSGKEDAVPLAPPPVAPIVPSRAAYRAAIRKQPQVKEFRRSGSLSRSVANAAAGKSGGGTLGAMLHSENAFAFDLMVNEQRLTRLLERFDRALKPASIIAVALDVDSYPNTMCGGMCRASVNDARERLHAAARAYFGHRFTGMTHSRVYANKPFQIPAARQQSFEEHMDRLQAAGTVASVDPTAAVPAGVDPWTGHNFEARWGERKVKWNAGKTHTSADISDGHRFRAGGRLCRISGSVPGDGNCFFTAVANALGVVGITAQRIRTWLSVQMGDRNIGREGVWAEDEHLAGLAHHLGINLVVHVLGLDGQLLTTQTYNGAGPGGHTIEIVNVFFGHFENMEVVPHPLSPEAAGAPPTKRARKGDKDDSAKAAEGSSGPDDGDSKGKGKGKGKGKKKEEYEDSGA